MGRGLQRLLLIAGILLSALAVAAVLALSRPEPEKREDIGLAMLVEALELKPSAIEIAIRSQGTVMPRTETVLSAEISGAIVDVSPKFVAGGVFAANETLMRIDPTDYRSAVDSAKALVNQRQIEHDGAYKLRSQGFRAEAEYAAASAALAAAIADLERAERNLERTYIRVPYAGMVRNKEADLGQFVNPGTRLGVTFATDYAEIRLPLTDQDLAFVALPDARTVGTGERVEGQAVTLSATRLGRSEQWPARIVRSEGVVDENSRVSYAVARVEDPYGFETDVPPLPIGSFVAAAIQGVAPDELIRVPRSTIRGSNKLVFVDGDNRLSIREVEVFRFDANYAYLLDTSLAGERIVTTALENPINGMAVRTTLDPQSGDDAPRIALSGEDGG
ncbi:MAG: efflux RND transporter periplasmic adaptor subunit [Pseudomonadota bacterium]